MHAKSAFNSLMKDIKYDLHIKFFWHIDEGSLLFPFLAIYMITLDDTMETIEVMSKR